MTRRQDLLDRLDAIGRSLAAFDGAVALLGLGSAGRDLARLDDYSDLDFFVIVADGYKRRFLDDLSWLSALCPVAYAFRNTVDGYKLLFDDGIFCEFAVFEQPELYAVPFAAGRLVWKQSPVDGALATPVNAGETRKPRAVEWLLGEALTNLYVGLERLGRGEVLSATRFIQGYAVDRVLELAEQVETAGPAAADSFAVERRFEQRFPGVAAELGPMLQGYGGNRESAEAVLTWLERHFAVNAAMAQAIRRMLR